jgi:hypothetical protein
MISADDSSGRVTLLDFRVLFEEKKKTKVVRIRPDMDKHYAHMEKLLRR